MNKMDSIFENSKLIAKKVTGRLTEQEQELFDRWINSSQQNQELYKKLEDNHNFRARNEQFENVNTKRAWEEFAAKLKIRKRRSVITVFFKYAAAILFPILIGLTTYYYTNRQVEQKNNIVQVADIKPGSRNAVLVLGDGKNIDLDKQEVGRLEEADGTIISKVNDELNYVGSKPDKSHKLLQNTLVIPRGGEYSLILSDSTRVFLNSMSKLVYPVRFSGDNREVKLEGEAYFEVHKDKLHPFVVSVNGMKINVLGTRFNVNAYQDEQRIYTTLIEGKVSINSENQHENEWFLQPDQQAVFDKSNTKVIIRNVDAKQFMQWTTGTYTFTNQSLEEIMKSLSRWYDFTYSFSDESLKSLRFEGGLNKYESIEPILDIITRTGKVKYEIIGKEIIFAK